MAQLYGPPSDGSVIPHELEDAIAADVTDTSRPIGAALLAAGLGQGGQGVQALATFGDSITAGQSGGIRWPELVSDWLGVPAYNPSVAGERPTDIVTRQGGLAPALTVEGDSIPAEVVPVAVTNVTPGGNWSTAGDGHSRGRFIGRLSGVLGELANTSTGWTFTRSTAGTVAVPSPSGSIFRVDDSKAHRSDIQTFWAGRNDNTTVLRDTRTMVAYLTDPKRFLVLSILTGGADTPGTGGYVAITERNAQIAAEWPDNYLDIRRYLIDNGLTDAGVTPTAQDEADIANDTVPTSLREDNIHPNALGHWVIGRRIAQEILSRGWVDPASAVVPDPMPAEAVPGENLGLVLSSGGAFASAPTTPELSAAQDISVRTVIAPDSVAATQTVIQRTVGTDQRAWKLFFLSSGVLRWQTFTDGTNAGVQTADSSASVTFVGGETFGLRVDHNSVARTVTFYTSADAGVTWDQLGTSKAITSGGIFATSTAPVDIGTSSTGTTGGLVGSVKSAAVLSLDGATTYISEDFTDGDATGWTLGGGAALG